MKLLSELAREITSGEIAPVYIFTGEEDFLIKYYLGLLSKDKRVKAFESMRQMCHTQGKSLFDAKPVLKVVYEPQDWGNYYQTTEKANVVVISSKLDKRQGFVKDHLDDIVQFDVQPFDVVYSFFQNKTRISRQNLRALYDWHNGHMTPMVLDLNKVRNLYADGDFDDINNAFLTLADDGEIGIRDDTNLIGAIGAFQKGDLRGCLAQLASEEPVSTNYLFYQTIWKSWLVASNVESHDNPDKTGLPRNVYNAVKYTNRFGASTLRALLLVAIDEEEAMKDGKLPLGIAIPHLVDALGRVAWNRYIA